MQKIFNFFVKVVVHNRYCNDMVYILEKHLKIISMMLFLAKIWCQIVLKINRMKKVPLYFFCQFHYILLLCDFSEVKILMELSKKKIYIYIYIYIYSCTFFHLAKI